MGDAQPTLGPKGRGLFALGLLQRRGKTLLCKSPTSDPATKRLSPQALDHTGSGTKVTPSLCSLVGPVTVSS